VSYEPENDKEIAKNVSTSKRNSISKARVDQYSNLVRTGSSREVETGSRNCRLGLARFFQCTSEIYWQAFGAVS